MIAINGRTGALRNELAVMDEPLTMEQYLAGRMIRDPMCIYDCDVPVDGADAFVLTTAERARDLPGPAVLIHAATVANAGARAVPGRPELTASGQHVAAASLRARSDLWIDDMDVYFPYDGFGVITLAAMEAMGFGAPGEVPRLLEDVVVRGRAAPADRRPGPRQPARRRPVRGRHAGLGPRPRGGAAAARAGRARGRCPAPARRSSTPAGCSTTRRASCFRSAA